MSDAPAGPGASEHERRPPSASAPSDLSLPISGVHDNLPRRDRPEQPGDSYELSDPSASDPADPAPSAESQVEPRRDTTRPIASGRVPREYALGDSQRRREQSAVRRVDPSPRVLILFWVLWLLGSWSATFGVDPHGPVQRWMIYAAVTGLLLLWPALRLSQDGPDHAGAPSGLMRRVLLDWVSLNLVMQTVIWPLHMIADWSFPQALWLDGALAAWSLLTGALIVAGCRSTRSLDRVVAMLLALAVPLAEPLAMWVVNLGRGGDPLHWTWRASPLQTLWHLTARPGDWDPSRVATQVIVIASAAVLAWIALVALKPWHGDLA